MMRMIFYLGILAATFIPAAYAGPSLVSKTVTVLRPDQASASLGRVIMPERELPGESTLIEDTAAKPRIRLLGCEFEVALDAANPILTRAAPVISRKLTTGGDPPVAGYGSLVSPKPIGIVDPITEIACERSLTYFIFLFRQTPAFGSVVIEAVVLEYDQAGRKVFEAKSFDDQVERESLQVRDAVQVARRIYRMSFRTREDQQKAVAEQEAATSRMLFVLPKLLGIPLP